MNEQLAFFKDPQFWTALHAILNWIFGILDIALCIGFAYALTQAWPFRPKLCRAIKSRTGALTLRTAVFRDRWQEVVKRLALQTPDAMRLSVIEADALVDSILKDLGFEGGHMADRLSKITPESLACIDRLWHAHRLRNELVKTPDFSISESDAQKAIGDYEAFLKEIKIL